MKKKHNDEYINDLFVYIFIIVCAWVVFACALSPDDMLELTDKFVK